MLADIDDPPKSRARGLLLAFLIATPIAGVFALWVIPTFVGSIVSGARDLDDRLRANDAYVQEVCNTAYDGARDEALCGCVWAMEFPSLDCRPQVNRWSLARQREACADETLHDASLQFCTCVEAVSEKIETVPSDDEKGAESLAYERCESLEDALELPSVVALGAAEN